MKSKCFTRKNALVNECTRFVDFYVKKKYEAEVSSLISRLPEHAKAQERIVGESEVDFSIEEYYVEICKVLQIEDLKWCPSGCKPLFEVNFSSEVSTSENIAFTEAGQRVFKDLLNSFEQSLIVAGFVKVDLKDNGDYNA